MAVISKDLGPVSAYAVAVANGFTGTEAEWEQYIANASTAAQSAAGSATAAASSASAAAQSATAAAASQVAAAGSETEAANYALVAGNHAMAAAASATAAETAETGAESAQTAAEAAQAAAEAVAESIPEDYTALTEEVGGLKSALNYSANEGTSHNVTSLINIATTNSAINTSGAVTNNSAYLRSDYIPVWKDWKVKYTSLNGGASLGLLCFYTAESESSFSANPVPGQGASVPQTGVYVAPSDGYIRLCTRSAEYANVSVYIESPIADRLMALETDDARNTDLIENLVDMEIGTWTEGYYIDASDGVAKAWTSTNNRIYHVSPFISVANISRIAFNCVSGYAFYTTNAESGFISNSGGGDSTLDDYLVDVPSTAKYFRFTKETKKFSYTPYLRNADSLRTLTSKLTVIENQADGTANAVDDLVSRLVIPVTWRENYYIGDDGLYKSFTPGTRKYWASEAINVRNVTKLRFTGIRSYAFYNASDTLITGEAHAISTDPILVNANVPDDAVYFRYTKETNKYSYDATLYDYTPVYSDPSANDHYPYLVSCFRTIGVVGDSLASGESVSNNTSSTNHDLYDHSWLQYMARYFGFTGYNFSKGGLSTRSWLTDTKGWTLAQESGKECNAYIIGLGANDLTLYGESSAYLGTPSDIGTSADTYYGNYSRIIANLKTIRPKAKFFLLTLSYNYIGNEDRNTASVALNEAVAYIAEHTDNCYLIDTSDDQFFWSPIVTSNKRSGHYNAVAYNAIGMHIAERIGDYIYQHMNDFRQIEFIDTEWQWN